MAVGKPCVVTITQPLPGGGKYSGRIIRGVGQGPITIAESGESLPYVNLAAVVTNVTEPLGHVLPNGFAVPGCIEGIGVDGVSIVRIAHIVPMPSI